MRPRLRVVSNPSRAYYAGVSPSHQLLMGFLPPGLVLVRFDLQGQLRDVQDRPLPKEIWDEWRLSPVNLLDPSVVPRAVQGFQQWQEEIGFSEAPVNLYPFDLDPRYPIALDIVSGMSRHMVAHPDEYDPEEVEEAQNEITEWNDRCMHAFTWNEEYLLRPDGQIVST